MKSLVKTSVNSARVYLAKPAIVPKDIEMIAGIIDLNMFGWNQFPSYLETASNVRGKTFQTVPKRYWTKKA